MLIEAVDRCLALRTRPGSKLLIAMSGGVDSMVLLHAAANLAECRGLELVVGHVNHGLRGADSDADERHVAGASADFGFAFFSERVDPGTRQNESSSNRGRPTLQEAARQLRYAALHRMREAAGAARMATAHQLDDQAETVLMRLFRGTSPAGLAGIPASSADGFILRPMLEISRREVVEYAERHQISWREDSSNRTLRYTRNRLREEWMPGLAKTFNPQLLRAIGKLADAQRQDEEWMDSMVATAWPDWVFESESGEWGLREKGWNELPEALARRLVVRVLQRAGMGRELTRLHVERVRKFLEGRSPGRAPRRLELPQGLVLRDEGEGFRLSLPRGSSGSGKASESGHAILPGAQEGTKSL